jgi:hypothetical protein
MGLVGQNETDNLFPLRAHSTLSLWQVKPKVFDNILANLGFLSETLYSAFHKRREGGNFLP